MDEYIDRQEAKEWIADWLRNDKYWHPYSKGKNIPTGEVFDILCRIPAADVQPVKHGKWIWDDEGYHCTECFYHAYDSSLEIMQGIWNHCPHCGARMDGR